MPSLSGTRAPRPSDRHLHSFESRGPALALAYGFNALGAGIAAIAAAHRRFGTTGLLPTLISEPPQTGIGGAANFS